MLAKKYRSEIISILKPFEGIYTLELKTLGRKYKYLPGQFLHIAIDEEYDGVDQWPESRCFSIQNSAEEPTIKVTYAVKGRFTKDMKTTLKAGSIVWLKLPYGDLFTQPHNKNNTVFIAGGTGITPFLSLFNNSLFHEYVNPKLYLGFKSKSYNIYSDGLKSFSKGDVKISYEDKDGLLDINSIFSENGIESNYFISGPPNMIKAFKNRLIEHGVPDRNVLTDDWE